MPRVTTNARRDLDKPLVDEGDTRGGRLASRMLRGYLLVVAVIAVLGGLSFILLVFFAR